MDMNELDLKGLSCPEPMMMLRRAVRKMQSGETVKVITDDPSTLRDFVKFCEFQDHKLLQSETVGDVNEFVIEKGN